MSIVMLSRQRCDRLVGYGPDGFVVMRGNCYWVHKANGCNVLPPMIPYNFEKKKWDMHDSYLRIMCRARRRTNAVNHSTNQLS